jgi:hypothetical protein
MPTLAQRDPEAPAVWGRPSVETPVGVLSGFSPSTAQSVTDPFRRGLRELGYSEGRDIVLEYRFSDGREARLPALAADQAGHRSVQQRFIRPVAPSRA